MRTKRIYYLETKTNTYLKRHDLYNAGARWDAKGKHWWAPTAGPIKKAAEMLGGEANVVAAHVQRLPKVASTHRGGRPRARRKGKVTVVSAAELVATPSGDGSPLAATGTPFVRGRAGEDRRKAHDRRNEGSRPEAVLVVPMVHAPELG